MSRETITTWSWRVQYKPKKQLKKDRSFQEAHSEAPVSDEAAARATCAAKVADLQQGGYKVIEESVWANHRSVGTDDRALVVGYNAKNDIVLSDIACGENWDEVGKIVDRTCHTAFYCREDMHHLHIFVLCADETGDVIQCDRRDYPDYMHHFKAIQALCREHFKSKPTAYALHSREADRFELSLYVPGQGYQPIFDKAVLDKDAVHAVQCWLEDRIEAQEREDQQIARHVAAHVEQEELAR